MASLKERSREPWEIHVTLATQYQSYSPHRHIDSLEAEDILFLSLFLVFWRLPWISQTLETAVSLHPSLYCLISQWILGTNDITTLSMSKEERRESRTITRSDGLGDMRVPA